MEFPLRINKYLAQKGLSSRREADVLIEKGLVQVNGQKAVVGQMVAASDTVTISGKKQPAKRYLAYYKGRGIITHSPGANEKDIATKLAEDYGINDIYPIGRLDKDSEGLILLTNDGRVTGPLLDPERGHEREYDVTVDKPINQWFLRHMQAGVNIEGYTTKPATLRAHPQNKSRFTIVLTEGKKHQIRRMCAALGYQVTRLKRVRMLHIKIDKLKPNQYRKLAPDELTTLLHTLEIAKS